MKTLTISFLLVVASVFTLFSQSPWQQVYGPQNQFLYKCVSVNSNAVVAVGESGLILRSENGGNNWQQIVSGTNSNLENLSFAGNNGIACSRIGNQVILKTTNGGINWVNINLQSFFYHQIKKVYVLNENTFFMLTENTGNMQTFYGLYRSTNGGNNWTSIYSTSTNQGGTSLVDVEFKDEQTGYLCTYNKVFKTTNSGTNWNEQVINTGLRPLDIRFFNETGYLTAFFYDYNTQQYSNKMYKTTSGGASWVEQTVPASGYFVKSDFFDINSGMIITETGSIIKTTNGGVTWVMESNSHPDIAGLRDMCMTGSRNAVTAGSYSVIFKYDGLTGIIQQNSQIPNGFSLSQNYPNPFNPNTKISFSIPKASFVKMTVYDITGKEVETLVNVQIEAGTFEVDFNASKFTSGVYFYRITADGFTDVKKMMLVK